jgi:DNA mismatch endonuclease (patch repair protein)
MVFYLDQVAVLMDGCCWHGCPEHYSSPKTNSEFWTGRIQTNMERDAKTARLLDQYGWLILRFWKHEPAGLVAEKIRK